MLKSKSKKFSPIDFRRDKRGFSLIELIVVIAIIGILVMLAAPKFIGYTEKAKLARIQNDSKVAEDMISIYMIENEGLPSDAKPITVNDINVAISENKVYSSGSLVVEDLVDNDINYHEITDSSILKDTNIKKGNRVVVSDSGAIYYFSSKPIKGQDSVKDEKPEDNKEEEVLDEITGCPVGQLKPLALTEGQDVDFPIIGENGEIEDMTTMSLNEASQTLKSNNTSLDFSLWELNSEKYIFINYEEEGLNFLAKESIGFFEIVAFLDGGIGEGNFDHYMEYMGEVESDTFKDILPKYSVSYDESGNIKNCKKLLDIGLLFKELFKELDAYWNSNEEDYTLESWQEYTQAYNEALEIEDKYFNKKATQEEIDKAASRLKTARENLVLASD